MATLTTNLADNESSDRKKEYLLILSLSLATKKPAQRDQQCEMKSVFSTIIHGTAENSTKLAPPKNFKKQHPMSFKNTGVKTDPENTTSLNTEQTLLKHKPCALRKKKRTNQTKPPKPKQSLFLKLKLAPNIGKKN